MCKTIYVSFSLCCLLMLSSTAVAQHYTHTFRYTGEVEIDHMPEHDQVVPAIPDNLILRFSDHVALVKLIVKDAEGKLIDISFRYDPIPNRVFIWPLPTLPESPYYSVDWGAVDRQNKMMQGQFLFSAGPNAVKPSTLVPEPVEEDHIKVPDYRLLDLNIFRPVGP